MLGDSGRIYDEETEFKRASFSVPEGVHRFVPGDVDKMVRITGATQECNNGVWRVVGQVAIADENAVQLQRSDDLWEEESGLYWEMGYSPGMAFEGSRYADFIARFSRGLISTICTFEWDQTLEQLGASSSTRRKLPESNKFSSSAKHGGMSTGLKRWPAMRCPDSVPLY